MEITINAKDAHDFLDDLNLKTRLGPSRLQLATARAINRTLIHTRKKMITEIRAVHYIKAGELNRAITLKKAKAGKETRGTLTASGDLSLPLIHFRGKQLKGGVSVKVLKTSRASMLRPGGSRKIIATKKSGRAAVWIAKGNIYARVEDSDHPVVLFGPNFMTFLNRPGVADRLNRESSEMLKTRIRHEAEFLLTGAGKASLQGGA